MKTAKDWIRKDLKDFEPYHEQNIPCKSKLNANESPFALTQRAKDELIKWIQNGAIFNEYPDTDSTELRNTLADYWKLQPDNFVCGVGSDQIIDFILKVFVESGDKIVIPTPTFSMYAITGIINKACIVEVETKDKINPKELIEAVKNHNAKILFLCNPNNPTGELIPRENIIEILENVDCPVVLDEAYGEFSKETLIPDINNYQNLIILRTFSKAYSLAAVRVGYAVGNSQIIDSINIVKTPYNLSAVSEKLAVLALKDCDEYAKRVDYLNNQSYSLYEALKQFSWLKVYPTKANFVFVHSEKAIADYLLTNGILIRKLKPKAGYAETLRFSVGTAEQNKEIIDLLNKL